MKKTVIACIAVVLAAILAAVLLCAVTNPPRGAPLSPVTADLNFLIVVPIMLMAAFIVFIIIKRRRE